jgi:hypothetical protein
VDDFLVRAAAAWALRSPGIVWYEHVAYGEALAKLSGLPLYGPGAEASVKIVQEHGKRSIIASMRAHGEIKNLQMFSRNLFTSSPASSKAWEQIIGRTHRLGQTADEVTVDVFLHTSEFRNALETALGRARYKEATLGTCQKILYATMDIDELL